MKTAGQDFLGWYNKYVENNGCSPSDYDVNFYWTGGNLEKEKQQIINCAIKTTQDCWLSNAEYLGLELKFTEQDLKDQKSEAEQYYKETFKKD